MLFKSDLTKQSFDNILYLYKDESIISDYSGDYTLYFGGCWFGLSIDKKTRRILNFEGYSSNFYPTNNIEIPVSKKGAIYIDTTLENDGAYYPMTFGFLANGVYDAKTGWYRVGADCKSGEVIEVATNTLINIDKGIIQTIYFKTKIAKE